MPKLIEAAGEAGFSTLLKALEAGALTEFLGGDGPFTLLAPTDEAFAALAPELLNRLLADEERLNNLLRYHVLQGRYTASDLTGLDTVTTLEGSDLQVETDDGVRLDEATVVRLTSSGDRMRVWGRTPFGALVVRVLGGSCPGGDVVCGADHLLTGKNQAKRAARIVSAWADPYLT